MNDSDKTNMLSYLIVILVIIGMIGSWMAFAMGPGLTQDELDESLEASEARLVDAITEAIADPVDEVTRAHVVDFLTNYTWSDAESILQDAGVEVPDVDELQINLGMMHEVPQGTGAYADFESHRVWEMEDYYDWLNVRQEFDVDAVDAPSVTETLIEDFEADIVFTHYEPIGMGATDAGLHEDYEDVLFVIEAFGDPDPETPPESAHNVVRFMPGTYYGMYLMGMVAAGYAATQNNRVGFLNSEPLNLSIRRLNAYVLGAQEVNPDVEIYNHYAGIWYDPAIEGEVASMLIDDYDVSVITKVTDSPVPNEIAGDAEVYYQAQGGNPPALDKGDARWHAGSTPASNEIVIRDMIQEYILGDWPASIQWRRMEARPAWEPDADFFHNADLVNEERVGMDAINEHMLDAMDEEIVDLIALRREQLIEGAWDPFHGEVIDEDGELRSEFGERFTVSELIGMDWHVDGIIDA